jgi:hypothetical protein
MRQARDRNTRGSALRARYKAGALLFHLFRRQVAEACDALLCAEAA